MLNSKYKIPEEVQNVLNSLDSSGFQAFLVGGCVRDLISDKEPKDWDVTTNKGQSDIWVFIIDEDGTMTFETTIGGTNLDFGSSAIQTLEDEIVIVGDTESNDFDVTLNRGIKDLIVIKIK